jgi:predicted lipoprotein with Yx(FWY)xxD motif
VSTPHRTPSSRPASIALGAALLLTLGLAGCSTAGSAAPSPSPSPAAQGDAPTTTDSSPSVDVTVAATTLGKVVVDGKGMTAYYFDTDVKDSGKSTCTGGCATAWPAIEATTATPKVSGITGKVGTITGVDGGRQITIDGRPIYTFVGDKKAGDVTGQGDKGVWYVVNPDGSEQKK